MNLARSQNKERLQEKTIHDSLRMLVAILEHEETVFLKHYNFLFHQIGYMYWRYFMWNFTGRQNDIQGDNQLMEIG